MPVTMDVLSYHLKGVIMGRKTEEKEGKPDKTAPCSHLSRFIFFLQNKKKEITVGLCFAMLNYGFKYYCQDLAKFSCQNFSANKDTSVFSMLFKMRSAFILL